jgi:polyketide cyclase/dehydrase/lipid transport protein
MNTFLKFFGIIMLSVVVVGLIIPNHVDIRRSVEIDAPVTTIHAFTSNLEKWPQWSPWITEDPSIKISLGDIHQGTGASQSWTGASGSGNILFTQSSPEQGVVYDMNFDGDSTLYQAGFSYQEKGQKTIVTWYMTGDMTPIIIGNYFSLMMDGLVGDSFVMGLDKLKELSEDAAS